MTVLNIDNLVAETNKLLPRQQQVHPDDPILTTIILNNQILTAQVDAINKKLAEALQQISAASENQSNKAEVIADRIFSAGTKKIEEQLNAVVLQCKQDLKKEHAETKASIRRASRLAWIGAVLITLTACCFVGTWLGNTIFAILHPNATRTSKARPIASTIDHSGRAANRNGIR